MLPTGAAAGSDLSPFELRDMIRDELINRELVMREAAGIRSNITLPFSAFPAFPNGMSASRMVKLPSAVRISISAFSDSFSIRRITPLATKGGSPCRLAPPTVKPLMIGR